MILNSPQPFIAGVKTSYTDFQEEPKRIISKGQSNRLVTYYIDESEIEYCNFDTDEIFVPQFKGMLFKFKKNFEKMHRIKKSRYVRLDKTKKKGKSTYKFRIKQKPDKKIKTGTVKQENLGRAEKYSNFPEIKSSNLID